MLYVVEDEKGEIVDRPGGGGAIFLTEEEATKLMVGHPTWILRKSDWKWP